MKSILLGLFIACTLAAQATPAKNDVYPLKTCIVTGDEFGGDLGAPIDVNFKGHLIRLCCKSCVKKFNANPEKYLAIYNSEVAKQKH